MTRQGVINANKQLTSNAKSESILVSRKTSSVHSDHDLTSANINPAAAAIRKSTFHIVGGTRLTLVNTSRHHPFSIQDFSLCSIVVTAPQRTRTVIIEMCGILNTSFHCIRCFEKSFFFRYDQQLIDKIALHSNNNLHPYKMEKYC